MEKSKKIILSVLLAFGIAGTITFVACNDKEEETTTINSGYYTQEKIPYKNLEIYNPSNPYDKYGSSFEKLFEQMRNLITSNPNSSYDYLTNESHRIIEAIQNKYPVINFETYSTEDTATFLHFMAEFVNDVTQKGLIETTKSAEKKLLSMPNTKLRDDLLCAVSETKYAMYYTSSATPYGDRWDNCIRNTMRDIMDGPIGGRIVYIVTLPESALGIIASCAITAALDPTNPICR